jgi:phage replication O-like protein O
VVGCSPNGFTNVASPQKENGYTAIANEIIEHLSFPGISGSEYRILLVVIRKTYGFQKKSDRISLSQFQIATQMNRAQAVETLKELVHKRILVKEENRYRFNKNWEEWVVCKRIPPVCNSVLPSMQLHTKSSMQKHTHKRKKENNTKEIQSATETVAGIPEVIDSFKEVNPVYKKWFGRIPQRDACRRLIEANGLERVLSVVKLLDKTNKMQYFPTITTPMQLEDKWAALKIAFERKKGELEAKDWRNNIQENVTA